MAPCTKLLGSSLLQSSQQLLVTSDAADSEGQRGASVPLCEPGPKLPKRRGRPEGLSLPKRMRLSVRAQKRMPSQWLVLCLVWDLMLSGFGLLHHYLPSKQVLLEVDGPTKPSIVNAVDA